MPNFKIPEAVRTHIAERAELFAKRTVDYAQADFPLTVAQVQRLVLADEMVTHCRALEAGGMRAIRKHDFLRVVFTKEGFPGLRRSVSVLMNLPEYIFITHSTSYGMTTIDFEDPEYNSNYIVAGHERMDDEEKTQLAAWLNQATQAVRLSQLTIHSVAYIVQNHVPTIAHLHYLWPTLAKLPGRYHSDHPIGKFNQRVGHLPRYAKPYQPHPTLKQTYKRIIEAADMVLLKGMMLDAYDRDNTQVRATIEQWEQREGDATFPVEVSF